MTTTLELMQEAHRKQDELRERRKRVKAELVEIDGQLRDLHRYTFDLGNSSPPPAAE